MGNGNAYLVMLGYGRDKSAPTPGGVFAANFVGVRGYIAECFAIHFVVFATHLWNVRNVFVFCMLHIRITKVWFLFFERCIVAIRLPRIRNL